MKNKTINVAAALRLGHTMTIRKKEYKITAIDTFVNGDLGFYFQNVKDDQDNLYVADVNPMTIVTINIKQKDLVAQIRKEMEALA